MVENENKGMPLMTPTFFDENDPKNPKFINSDTPKNSILEVPYQNPKVTDKTIENIKKYPRFYQNALVRIYLGKIYKDGEFEKKSDRILSTPLPDGIQNQDEISEGKTKKFLKKMGRKFKK